MFTRREICLKKKITLCPELSDFSVRSSSFIKTPFIPNINQYFSFLLRSIPPAFAWHRVFRLTAAVPSVVRCVEVPDTPHIVACQKKGACHLCFPLLPEVFPPQKCFAHDKLNCWKTCVPGTGLALSHSYMFSQYIFSLSTIEKKLGKS